MTTKDKIKVMEAFENGERIQLRPADELGVGVWIDVAIKDKNILWNWEKFEYRIKPLEGPKYIPYSSPHDLFSNTNVVWIRNVSTGICYMITCYDHNDIYIKELDAWFNMRYLFKFFTYRDGSPIGKKEWY